jgi:hypothetical protein
LHYEFFYRKRNFSVQQTKIENIVPREIATVCSHDMQHGLPSQHNNIRKLRKYMRREKKVQVPFEVSSTAAEIASEG